MIFRRVLLNLLYQKLVIVGNHLFNYWRNLDWENQADQLINATISLNGTELCEPQGASYFRNVQVDNFRLFLGMLVSGDKSTL